MKRTALLILLSNIFFGANAQKNEKNPEKEVYIKYDFLTDSIIGETRECISINEKIKIEIYNVNRFMYDISFKNRFSFFDINRQNDEPKDLPKQDFSIKSESVIQSLRLEKIPPPPGTSILPFVDSIQGKDFDIALINYKSSKLSDIEKKYNEVRFYTSLLNDAFVSIGNYEIYYNELYSLLHREGVSLLDLINAKNIATQITLQRPNLDSLTSDVTTWQYWINDYLEKLESAYNNLSLEATKQIDEKNKKEMEKFKVDIETNINGLKKTKKQFGEFNFMQLVNEIKKLNDYFKPTNFTFKGEIRIPASTDKFLTDIVIEPKQKDGGIKSIVKKYEFNTKNGWKIDFSSGFFFNIGLSDNSYYKDTTGINSPLDTALTFIKQERNRNMFVPAVGILVHVYKRKCGEVAHGLSFGISTEDSKSLKYYLGVSYFLGKKDRFILNAGIVGGSVKRITGRYNKNEKYAIASLPEEIKTGDYFRVGGFVGVSYNISGAINQKKANEILGF